MTLPFSTCSPPARAAVSPRVLGVCACRGGKREVLSCLTFVFGCASTVCVPHFLVLPAQDVCGPGTFRGGSPALGRFAVLPRAQRLGANLSEGNLMPGARYSCAIRYAVAQCLLVVCNADEGSLDACEADALVLEGAALLVDACDSAVRRNACNVRLRPKEHLVDRL